MGGGVVGCFMFYFIVYISSMVSNYTRRRFTWVEDTCVMNVTTSPHRSVISSKDKELVISFELVRFWIDFIN